MYKLISEIKDIDPSLDYKKQAAILKTIIIEIINEK